MPLWKCNQCHHEWEGLPKWCDWCGAPGKILEQQTPLEKYIKEFLSEHNHKKLS